MKGVSVKVGVIGAGTVGAGVVRALRNDASLIKADCGATIEVARVVDLDEQRFRRLRLPARCFSKNYRDVLEDPSIQIVVELIGGTSVAREVVLGALYAGKHVVTANKALLAKCWAGIFFLAHARKRAIGFEASVMAGVPIMRCMQDGLAGNRIDSLHCILNGTSNFILTRMSEAGEEFGKALAEARARGLCEADATLDTEGFDAAQKLSILSSIALGKWLAPDLVYREGISQIEQRDLNDAREYFGYVLKPLAVFKRRPDGIEAHVHPTFIPVAHPLAPIRHEFNAALISADKAGLVTLAGKGAGEKPAASGVVSDIIAIARAICRGAEPTALIPFPPATGPVRIRPMEKVLSKFYLRFSVLDRPGVLAFISGALGRRKVSIATCLQRGRSYRGAVPILMVTHEALEGALRAALAEIDAAKHIVKRRTIAIRIEE